MLKKLSRKARMAVIIALVYEELGEKDNTNLPLLVWGNVHDAKDILEAMKPWGFQHAILFPDRKTSMFCIADSEVISNSIRSMEEVTPGKISSGMVFPRDVSNLVCSCLEKKSRSELEEDGGRIVFAPFRQMCWNCSYCKRYHSELEVLQKEVPHIRFGSRSVKSTEDNRHYKNLSTYKKLDKMCVTFSAFINDKKEAKEKRNKRGKKRKRDEDEVFDNVLFTLVRKKKRKKQNPNSAPRKRKKTKKEKIASLTP